MSYVRDGVCAIEINNIKSLQLLGGVILWFETTLWYQKTF